MKEFFFITGFPRSRTAWLANLFTWGNSFCFHDPTKYGISPLRVAEVLQRSAALYTGASDSGLARMARPMRRIFPRARWLIVHRPKGDAQDSFERFFNARPYRGMKVPIARKAMEQTFDELEKDILDLRKLLAPGTFIETDFEDLDSKLVLEEAWRFLTPANRWDGLRCEEMQMLDVNVRPEKVSLPT